MKKCYLLVVVISFCCNQLLAQSVLIEHTGISPEFSNNSDSLNELINHIEITPDILFSIHEGSNVKNVSMAKYSASWKLDSLDHSYYLGKIGVGTRYPNSMVDIVGSLNRIVRIDKDSNTIFGINATEKVVFGGEASDSKTTLTSGAGVIPLKVSVESSEVLVVNAGNQTLEIGGANGVDSPKGMAVNGDIHVTKHKVNNLGAPSRAFNDIYYDDLHAQGSASFLDRDVEREILEHPLVVKQKGSFDEYTIRGDKEVDPKSLPKGLHNDVSVLTDEVAMYNYQVNYQQSKRLRQIKKEIQSIVNSQAVIQEMAKQLN